ncbi:tyrosine-type recombinase/integrase [Prosthecomicrobium hirschii]|uniref:tyrosine-type recombinase/integrase n=1 Tax=Prosthecodimorpha hirschii TaxID=665126 RepID=UPI0022212A85|nr:tyrosine-type recombinase/integrase [Prosthecomicrobium hirschii]MCW1840436.1 tyrosine-type recombinase/integrase [Prosthecomicrobium hirschii]
MTAIRVQGFKIFRDRHGKPRCYHRATGMPIDLDKTPLGTAEFFTEAARIGAMVQAGATAKPGTLGMLIKNYREHDAFRVDIAERTRADYQRVFDYLKPIADTALTAFTTELIVRIRDKAGTKRGRRFGTMVKQVLSIVFGWGRERGFVKDNPARGVRGIKRPKDAPEANRPWSDRERDAVLAAAPPHMRPVLALMMFTGLDPQDAVSLPRTAVRDGRIDTRRGKTKVPVWIPMPAALGAILADAPQHSAITLCASSRGTPWTASGLRASWARVRAKLEEAKEVERNLTLKGLRHTVATILAEIGFDDRTIADMLGHRTVAMAAHYSRRADRSRKMTAVVHDLDAEVKRRTASVKPSGGGVKPLPVRPEGNREK